MNKKTQNFEPSGKWLSVPMDAQGIRLLENDEQDDFHVHEYELDQREWNRILEGGVLDAINAACDTTLKDRRKDIIPASALNAALDVLEENDLMDGVLAAALLELRYAGTYVLCDFA